MLAIVGLYNNRINSTLHVVYSNQTTVCGKVQLDNICNSSPSTSTLNLVICQPYPPYVKHRSIRFEIDREVVQILD